jgi:hypothetical protein
MAWAKIALLGHKRQDLAEIRAEMSEKQQSTSRHTILHHWYTPACSTHTTYINNTHQFTTDTPLYIIGSHQPAAHTPHYINNTHQFTTFAPFYITETHQPAAHTPPYTNNTHQFTTFTPVYSTHHHTPITHQFTTSTPFYIIETHQPAADTPPYNNHTSLRQTHHSTSSNTSVPGRHIIRQNNSQPSTTDTAVSTDTPSYTGNTSPLTAARNILHH